MNRFLLLIFSFLLLNFTVKSQDRSTYNAKFSEGNYLILEENYPQALKSFKEAYLIDSTNANINFKIGYCYIKTEATKNLAMPYLQKAIKNTSKNYDEDAKDEKVAPVTAHYYYGQALHLNYKFDEAIASYLKFKSYLTPGKHNALIKDVDRMIEISNNAKELMAIPTNYVIKNLGDSINSPYPDYSAVISADERTLIFTSRRPGSTGGDLTFEGDYFEDIYISHKKADSTWETPKSISPYINTDEHEASVGLIADGQTLLIYKNPPGGGDILESHLEGDNWTTPIGIEGDVNTSNWEPSACITPDGNTLYFVSNRPGGMGGRDIWTCVKLPNGKWSKATNLGPPINTEYDEDAPFIESVNDVLFFSSKGHKTMGGFDIFFANRSGSGWFEPQNIGYPINTVDDDLYYTTSPDGLRGYFTSSLRAGGLGEKDIYMAFAPTKKEDVAILIKGLVTPAKGDPLPSNIEIYAMNNEAGTMYSSKVLMRDGSFLFILPPNVKYTVSYQQDGQEFMTEDWGPYEEKYQEIKKEIKLLPAVKGQPLAVEGMKLNTLPYIDGKITVDGIAYDIDGKLAANQKVNLVNSKGEVVGTGTTDSKGEFVFTELPKDDYTIVTAEAVETTFNRKSKMVFKDSKNKVIKVKNFGKDKDNLTAGTKNSNYISADGVVYDNNCTPYANKKINLINGKGEVVKTVNTNSNGGFLITKLEPLDDYSLAAEDPEVSFCSKSKITFRDKKNQVVSSKNIGTIAPPAAKPDLISAEGVVYDNDCKPYANKQINLINSKGDVVKTATTNSAGGFLITKLETLDEYNLTAADPDVNFCSKSKITFKDKKNKVISSKNIGSVAPMAANSSKPEKHEQLAKVHHRKFEMYFKYNIFETDVADEPFKQYIGNLSELYKENGKINFNIVSCASQVPTKKFASNKDLSIARADKMKTQLITALKEKGIDESKINFIKVRSIVGGPTYNADYLTNKAVYEKYQFVKVSAY